MNKILIYIIVVIISNLEKIVNYISNLFVCFLIFSLYSCNAQIDNKELDKNLAIIQAQSNIPGFALTIIKGDKIEFEKGFWFCK